MKTNWLVGSVFLAGTMVLHAQTNDLSAALRQGLFEEEANRNLDAAVSNYQALAAQFDQNRQIAATAIFRLGECYRKLGQTNEAVSQYQRIVREFPDQQTLATLSQQNLAGLGVAFQPRFQQRLQAVITKNPDGSTASTTAESPAGAAAMEAEAAALKTQIEHLSSLKREDCRIAVQQNYSNLVLTTLIQQLNEAELTYASLTNEYTLTNLHVTRVAAQMNAINGQIDAQVNGVIRGLQAQMEADLSAAKTLRDKPGTVPATQGEAATVTGDEDQEIRRIQQMIQNSPDLINAPSGENKLTPLCTAADRDHLRVAAFLLANGADVNVKASEWSPLLFAAAAGHKAMVELLLANGADMNAREYFGKTTLHLAAENGFQSVAEVLLANKADVNARDKTQETPLHLASAKGHSAMVAFLLAHQAEPDAQDEKGETPVILAARAGHAEALRQLLAAGAQPDVANREGVTPLTCAVVNGRLDSVKILLASKADPNAGTINLPLAQAVWNRQLEIAELLLRAGADPNRPAKASLQLEQPGAREERYPSSPYGPYTPLQIAVAQSDAAMARLLFQFKADLNTREPWTADADPLIFYAFGNNNLEMLKAFLAAGADPDTVDAKGHLSLLDYAARYQMADAVAVLLAKGARVNPAPGSDFIPLLDAISESPASTNTVRLLLDAKADTNARDAEGATPLLRAMDRQNFAVTKLLLERGADPNLATPKNRRTPLHLAVSGRNTGLVQLLLDHKADPNLRNSDGQTPLDLAKTGPDPQPALADLLRQRGARDNLPNWGRITVSRPAANFSQSVFYKGTNDWNRFTLVETLLNFYPEPSFNPIRFSGGATSEISLPFPDLARVTILRHQQNTTNETRLKVNLLNATNGIDCSRDVPLEFGDVVELPEREHALGDKPVGLTESQRDAMVNCRKGSTQLMVHGAKVELPVSLTDSSLIGSVLNRPEAQGILLSSSDLSRVKVTRPDPATGKKHEWILDCSHLTKKNNAPFYAMQKMDDPDYNAPGFRLRDGDVIEVPEKSN